MKQTAVVMVDIINDFQFDEGPDLLKYTKEILPNLKNLKNYARKNDIPFIYINDHYDTWETDYKHIINVCENDGNKEIIEQMRPEKEDYFLIKPQLSGFFRSPLPSLLEQLEVKHLIIAGVAGNICVLFTANDAHMRGYTLHVPENCVASNQQNYNDHALHLMKHVFTASTDPI
ncbi:isochorismatase family cysteine hydrolase [Saliterribacillus persicus]|uniref:Nicotinamidase-related amidase n=1 Tax=Saliterribacillus persicus TaxID=930114 RepID=A0A368XBL0_9BACI|nr:isochorismatase family cysteine hydrolase [Saliterribacillus persicus]RCW64596.1 nicotinamidase-related amidase [Saliterribacillus persicus]